MMKYVTLPDTDLQPSVLCLGSNRFGTEIGEAESFALLDSFFELGGTFIDTAHVYADWIPGAPRSASEKTIGRWLKARGLRERIIVATKGGHPELSRMHVSRLSQAELTRDVNESLAHLQVERIDLYWLHRDDPTVPVAAILETLNELVEAGKIRYFGCSNWRASRIREAHEYARHHGGRGFIASQPLWSLATPNQATLSDPNGMVMFDNEALDFHTATGMAVVPYSSQAQGLFDKLDQLGITGLKDGDRRRYDNEVNRVRFTRVKALAQRHATSPGVIALSYLLSQPFVTLPIIGPRTPAQLRASVEAVALTLAPEELRQLQAAAIPHTP